MQLVAGGSAFLAVLLLCCRYLAEPIARYPILFGPLIIGTSVAYATAFYVTFFASRRGGELRDALAVARTVPQQNRPEPEYG